MKHGLEITVAVIIIVFAAVFLVQDAAIRASGEEAWGGADGEAADLIEASGYEPWFESFWAPPSGEIESLFFALQAAIGAVIIGYVFGYWQGSRKTA
ncbi:MULTISPECIES: energy-coupling factor ABC transporter substrate-binding protein [unclassified Methanoculleus]|uniref:energy-coupling factor ABC transporter substrate-binding protein n=1 Tax=unclassified Methanoculleus TaxID=2619537 RepID=UPI0025E260A7|nr:MULTISPECIES: energy-coupling factor ABC transporter substrate-binding protein [unclassified Methanoculleus]MCK9318751.1 energy-coupling factor ABC transporter substrate-binding protein [Methanoculleus sp.]MDD2254645.1 energy-coupling factor ABC transporter substrate-binding protein [Methanoculleus sp.]MDD2788732.1 energy-coupling factor ABC transporter substrate-binding protein [Methanoculleus sp.]MDD3216829.1 energy-coupling factor ABC transporter substrate-binding protein [Methanoculleus 